MPGRKGLKLHGKQALLLRSILVSALLFVAALDMENPTETQEPFLGGKSSAGKCFQEDTQNFSSQGGSKVMAIEIAGVERHAGFQGEHADKEREDLERDEKKRAVERRKIRAFVERIADECFTTGRWGDAPPLPKGD